MKTGTKGFSLLELMIALVIAATLASIAIPSYRQYVMKARRTDATSALLAIATAQEKYFLANNQYAVSLDLLGLPADSPSGAYFLSTDGIDVHAAAIATGPQADDEECAFFQVVIATGERRSQAVDLSVNPTPDPCWN